MTENNMKNWLNELYAKLAKADALEAFVNFVNEGLLVTAREINFANDVNYMMALRGRINFILELADGAKAALDALNANANAQGAEGTPPDFL